MAGMLQLWPSSGRGCVNLTIRVPNRRPHMPAQAVCEMAGPQLPNSTSWELARGLRDAPLFPEPAFAASYQTPRGRRGSYGICSPPRASRAIQLDERPIQAQPASFGSYPASLLSSLLLRSRRYTRSCHPPASTPHSAAIFSPNSRVVGRAGCPLEVPPQTPSRCLRGIVVCGGRGRGGGWMWARAIWACPTACSPALLASGCTGRS